MWAEHYAGPRVLVKGFYFGYHNGIYYGNLTQRLQYPLIKEYTLNLIRVPIIVKVYSLIRGYIGVSGK